MAHIIPAIIASNIEEIQKKVKIINPIVSWAQIDVMDGKFTPQCSWPYPTSNPVELSSLPSNIRYEAHLMIEKPELSINPWLTSSISRILIHYESTHEIRLLINLIKNAGKEVGIVLKIETPALVVSDLINDPECKLDVIQLMGISEIGAYGNSFDERVLEKIRILREHHPTIPLEIDGGITLETGKKCLAAGATRLVAGSAIFRASSPQEALQALRNL